MELSLYRHTQFHRRDEITKSSAPLRAFRTDSGGANQAVPKEFPCAPLSDGVEIANTSTNSFFFCFSPCLRVSMPPWWKGLCFFCQLLIAEAGEIKYREPCIR